MISSLGTLQQEHFVYSSTKPWHNAAGYNKHLLVFTYSEAHLLLLTALQLTPQWQQWYVLAAVPKTKQKQWILSMTFHMKSSCK